VGYNLTKPIGWSFAMPFLPVTFSEPFWYLQLFRDVLYSKSMMRIRLKSTGLALLLGDKNDPWSCRSDHKVVKTQEKKYFTVRYKK
jgi:hypothetical protein